MNAIIHGATPESPLSHDHIEFAKKLHALLSTYDVEIAVFPSLYKAVPDGYEIKCGGKRVAIFFAELWTIDPEGIDLKGDRAQGQLPLEDEGKAPAEPNDGSQERLSGV